MSAVYSPLCWFLLGSLLLWISWFLRGTSGGRSFSKLFHPAPSVPTASTTNPPAILPQASYNPVQRLLPKVFTFVGVAFLPFWVLIFGLSTPSGSDLLRRSLIPSSWGEEALTPEYILVAAMGYVRMDDPAFDVLRDGTAGRVATAVRWWQEHPNAYLVMQGASGGHALGESHQAELMRQFAMSYGVPAASILLEGNSRNTREHVRCILEFPGITPTTSIGVVTSDWHMRRTAMEFRRFFHHISVFPAEIQPLDGLGFRNLFPGEPYLHASSLYLREWMAIAYYVLTKE